MTIREVLNDCKVTETYIDIMLRCYGPHNEDLLSGYATYGDNGMIDDEGCTYDLDLEVLDYEYDASNPHYEHGLLTMWFESEWVEG